MGRKVKRNIDPEAPEFRACHRYARISPPKARLVMDQVRDLPVNEALSLLRFSPRRGAAMIDKVLKSAIANADQAIDQDTEGRFEDLDVDDLYIHDCRIDTGPSFRRWRPRARGMAYPIIKRTSHITITLRAAATVAS